MLRGGGGIEKAYKVTFVLARAGVLTMPLRKSYPLSQKNNIFFHASIGLLRPRPVKEKGEIWTCGRIDMEIVT